MSTFVTCLCLCSGFVLITDFFSAVVVIVVFVPFKYGGHNNRSIPFSMNWFCVYNYYQHNLSAHQRLRWNGILKRLLHAHGFYCMNWYGMENWIERFASYQKINFQYAIQIQVTAYLKIQIFCFCICTIFAAIDRWAWLLSVSGNDISKIEQTYNLTRVEKQ